MSTDVKELLTTKEVADRLGIHHATVAAWRQRDYGPRAIQLGGCWRYPAADLADWLDTRPDRAG